MSNLTKTVYVNPTGVAMGQRPQFTMWHGMWLHRMQEKPPAEQRRVILEINRAKNERRRKRKHKRQLQQVARRRNRAA